MLGTYGEQQDRGISTKHVGSHRWYPKHVKAETLADKLKTDDKKKDNSK